jgi:large subunit ribosomal protein L16
VTAKQIEATRRIITRKLKRNGKVWIRIFPHIPITSKPIEVRMGKGKGAVSHYIAPVKPGTLVFEVDGVSTEVAKDALLTASKKLPVKCAFVDRNKP